MSIPRYEQIQQDEYFAEAEAGFAHEDWSSHIRAKFVLAATVIPVGTSGGPAVVATIYEYGESRDEVPLTVEDAISFRAFLDTFIAESGQ